MKDIANIIQLAVGAMVGLLFLVLFIGAGYWFLYTHQAPQSSTRDWQTRDITTDLPDNREGRLVQYGYKLVTETPKWMGPQVSSPMLRYSGNNLTCQNCHLNGGKQPGAASWLGITQRFPQFRARENKMGTLEDRINGCMERSMNGKPLPENSTQMKAIVAYMDWISEGITLQEAEILQGFTQLELPQEAASPAIGKIIYAEKCEVCHGTDGAGIPNADPAKGYLYPPLWGKDTYNHGAGMNRVLTAAEFIKANMPWGQASRENPLLTDEEAYHVAAYVDSFDRPLKANADQDFPDLKLKPVSTPYGPWDDQFSEEQHKYGPFQPIMAYYQETYNLKKSK